MSLVLPEKERCSAFPGPNCGGEISAAQGSFFLFLEDIVGGDWYQIFRFDVSKGNTTLLTDGKSRNSKVAWSNRGDRIAYASTRRNKTDFVFYVIDIQDKASDKEIAENHGAIRFPFALTI